MYNKPSGNFSIDEFVLRDAREADEGAIARICSAPNDPAAMTRARAEYERNLPEIVRNGRLQLESRIAERKRADLAGFMKCALAHWHTVAVDIEAFVAVHADWLVAEEEQIAAAYRDPSTMGATTDECFQLAVLALEMFPGELAFSLPKAEDRTAEKLAYIFRRYAGDYHERILPAAHALVSRRSHPAATTSTFEPKVLTGPPLSRRVAEAMSRLPADLVAAIEPRVRAALTLADMGMIKAEVLDARRAELEQRGVPAAELRAELELLADNLRVIDRDWATEQGMVSHDSSL